MSEISDPIKIAALRPDTDGHTLVVKLSTSIVYRRGIRKQRESSVINLYVSHSNSYRLLLFCRLSR